MKFKIAAGLDLDKVKLQLQSARNLNEYRYGECLELAEYFNEKGLYRLVAAALEQAGHHILLARNARAILQALPE